MLAWVASAGLGGFFQAWRTSLQSALSRDLGVAASSFVRFGLGLPFACVFALLWFGVGGQALPSVDFDFAVYACLAGIAQICGTALLIKSFHYRGFLVGTAFSKTEAIQAAIVAAIVLGERLSALAWGGILIGVIGVILIALPKGLWYGGAIVAAMRQPVVGFGLASGTFYAATGVFVKAASLATPSDNSISTALVVLVTVLVLQTALQGIWMALREPAALLGIRRQWRTAILVGLLSTLGSMCWFIGFALAPVALVRIVGQVEVVFTMAFSRMALGERASALEFGGLLFIIVGVVMALASQLA